MRNRALLLTGLLCLSGIGLPITGFAQTLDRIRSSGAIQIGFVPDQAPFSSASGGKATGYSIELCRRVAEAVEAKLGGSRLALKYRPTTVSAGIDLVASGQVDLLCGAISATLARREKVSFSIPIYSGGIGVLVRSDAPPALYRVLRGEPAHTGPRWRSTINQGLADHTYAVHAGTTGEEWVRKQVATLGVIATVVTVNEHSAGVDMVANRKADAYFADRVILQGLASAHAAASDLSVLERNLTFEPQALALARNDDDFRLAVDSALSRLYGSAEFADLLTRYFGAPSDLSLTFFKAISQP